MILHSFKTVIVRVQPLTKNLLRSYTCLIMCTHGASTSLWIYWPPCPPPKHNFRQHSRKQNALLFFVFLFFPLSLRFCSLKPTPSLLINIGKVNIPPSTPTPAWRSINNESKSHGTLTSPHPTPTPAWRSINNVSKSHGTPHPPAPTPAWRSINNVSKSHGTLTFPPHPRPLRGVASTTRASLMER